MSDWFNAQVFQSVLRWLIDKVGIIVVSHGLLTNDEASVITGAVVSLAVVVFGVISARFKNSAIEAAGGKSAVKDAIAAKKFDPTGRDT